MEVFIAKMPVYKKHQDAQVGYYLFIYTFILFCSLSLPTRLCFLALDRESRQ